MLYTVKQDIKQKEINQTNRVIPIVVTYNPAKVRRGSVLTKPKDGHP
jgi:hypothetical protein